MKILENGKGQSIGLIFLGSAFAAWAFVVQFASDDIAGALKAQTVVMEQIRQEQVEMRVRITALEVKVEMLQQEVEKHEVVNND